jgi:phosphoribosylaminoimidazole-succinocarboxamide synthase
MGSDPAAMLPRSLTPEQVEGALERTVDRTDFVNWGAKYEGKVRDNYTVGDGRRIVVATDRISAFDHVLGTIPFKGQVLNRLASFWFERTRAVAPNHMLSVPDPNILECVECTPLKVEMVVRGYLTGTTSTSIWTHYVRGARTFCGHALPDGMRKNQRLARPLLTPATKAPKGEHDVSGSREELLATGMVTARDFDEAAELAMALFEFGSRECAARGLLLVDTKYEFGRDASGRLLVIDEVHTADSSRFWEASTYDARFAAGEDPEPLDKDFVRRHYVAAGYTGDGPPPALPRDVRIGAALRYAHAFERITGASFEPNLEEPKPRMERNLRALTSTSRELPR